MSDEETKKFAQIGEDMGKCMQTAMTPAMDGSGSGMAGSGEGSAMAPAGPGEGSAMAPAGWDGSAK